MNILKSILILAATFLSLCSVAQDTSFLHFFYNDSLGTEFIGGINQHSLDTLLLLSSAEINNNTSLEIRYRKILSSGKSSSISYHGETNNYDFGKSIFLNSNIYATGIKEYEDEMNNYNIFITKLNDTGIVFEYEYGAENTFERGYGLNIDVHGDIVACGLAAKYPGAADNESVVIKIDTLGNEIWTTKIRARYNEIKARAVTTDSDGYIYVLADDDASSPTVQQAALIKLSPQGDSLWTKYYHNKASLAKDIQFNKNGNLTASITGDFDGKGRSFTLLEIDTSGTILWHKSYIKEVGSAHFAQRFIQLRDGGYAICVKRGYPALIVTDKKGKAVNVQHFDYFRYFDIFDLIELHDGSFAMAGNISDRFSEIPKVMWLIKTNTKGELITPTIDQHFPDLKIYPNPTHGVVNIKGIEHFDAYVINHHGQLITTLSDPVSIDLSQHPAGMYYIIISSDGTQAIHKIIKQ